MIVVFVVLSMGHDVCVQGTAAISQLLGLGTPRLSDTGGTLQRWVSRLQTSSLCRPLKFHSDMHSAGPAGSVHLLLFSLVG